MIEKHSRMHCRSSDDLKACAKERAWAIKKGTQLLNRMEGKGWRLRVHENLGWHYRVTSGPLYVGENGDGTCWAMVSDDPKTAGSGLGMWTTKDIRTKDPNKAARAALKAAKVVVDRLNEVVKAGEKACEKDNDRR